jgi:hypothetical protein
MESWETTIELWGIAPSKFLRIWLPPQKAPLGCHFTKAWGGYNEQLCFNLQNGPKGVNFRIHPHFEVISRPPHLLLAYYLTYIYLVYLVASCHISCSYLVAWFREPTFRSTKILLKILKYVIAYSHPLVDLFNPFKCVGPPHWCLWHTSH